MKKRTVVIGTALTAVISGAGLSALGAHNAGLREDQIATAGLLGAGVAIPAAVVGAIQTAIPSLFLAGCAAGLGAMSRNGDPKKWARNTFLTSCAIGTLTITGFSTYYFGNNIQNELNESGSHAQPRQVPVQPPTVTVPVKPQALQPEPEQKSPSRLWDRIAPKKSPESEQFSLKQNIPALPLHLVMAQRQGKCI